jgi:hypothetical protein
MGFILMANAFEKHFRVKQLALLWDLSRDTITRLFEHEPGVMHVATRSLLKRKYSVLVIPESVALRVHERLVQDALQSPLPAGRPPRIIRLGDLDAGVAKKTRNVLKLHPGKELANSKRVA